MSVLTIIFYSSGLGLYKTRHSFRLQINNQFLMMKEWGHYNRKVKVPVFLKTNSPCTQLCLHGCQYQFAHSSLLQLSWRMACGTIYTDLYETLKSTVNEHATNFNNSSNSFHIWKALEWDHTNPKWTSKALTRWRW